MKKEGKCKCGHCGKEFEWFYQVPKRNGFGLPEAEEIPKNTASLFNIKKSIERNGYKFPLEATTCCLYCEYPNDIEIKPEED